MIIKQQKSPATSQSRENGKKTMTNNAIA